MISDALRNYKYVTGALFHQEISADYTFQKAYCELYNLGDDYPEEFKTKFFRLLENMKKKSDISFRDAFEELLSFGGKNEMAVSSILVHTIKRDAANYTRTSRTTFMRTQIQRKVRSLSRPSTSGSPVRTFRT